MNKPLIISIEGNIGSGKSTYLKKLSEVWKDRYNIYFLDEPVDEWLDFKDENGEHILSKFYKNQDQYSFTFQIMAYISRLNKLKTTINNIPSEDRKESIIFTERSLATDKHVFAKMLYDDNKMEKIQYDIYNKWFDSFNKETEIDKIIYIQSRPTTCHQRVTLRDRDGENNIPLDYLSSCHAYHEKMIKTEGDKKKEILVLDGNNNIFKNPNVIDDWITETARFASSPNTVLQNEC
tara:strand:- start:152 stop:859 length:708 start_codon:yes stop_codon:yes gene_type:complete